jgi:geranylgeranyl diphosphate synthase type II
MIGEYQLLKAMIDRRLAEIGGTATVGPARLPEAMRYSLLAPAKRVRPIITVLAAEQLGGAAEAALDLGVAVELVHAASLVLDDLPAMDNAQERRGRPANHRVWGEDTAMLAAVALLNQAYGVIATAAVPDRVRVTAAGVLAAAVGPDGLTGGQELDLRARGDASADDIEQTYRLKTAVLFGAAAQLGGLAAGGKPDATAALHAFGQSLGLAFQAFDDVLDAHAVAGSVGKDVRQDKGKPTLVSLLGREGAEQRARAHVRAALAELGSIGGTETRLGRFASELIRQLTAPLGCS